MPITYFKRVKSICNGCQFESRPDSCAPITFEGIKCPCSDCLLKVICKVDCPKMHDHMGKCYKTLFDVMFHLVSNKYPKLDITDSKEYRFGIDITKEKTDYIPTHNIFNQRYYIYDIIEHERCHIYIYKKKHDYQTLYQQYITGNLHSR